MVFNISVVLGSVLHVLYDPTGSVPHVLNDPGELCWSVYAVLHVVLDVVLIPGDNLLQNIYIYKFSYCYFYMNIEQNLLGPKVSVEPWLALRISGTLGFSKYFRWGFKHFSIYCFKMNEILEDNISTLKMGAKRTEILVYKIDRLDAKC